MKKLLGLIFVTVLCVSFMIGCCMSHDWKPADCENSQICTKCGKTEGDALGHDWKLADCEMPQTCTQCGKVEGESLGHDWKPADCEMPQTCAKCGKAEGDALGHDWKPADCQNPKTCTQCSKTEGEAIDHSWQDATITQPMTCSICGVTRGNSLLKYDEKTIFLDCDAFVELLGKQLDSMGYVISEQEENNSNSIRNFEVLKNTGEPLGMTLVLPYDPDNLNIICLKFVWPMKAEELEDEIDQYIHIVTAAYAILCPEGMDDNLQLQISGYVGTFGALITPINAPLDLIDW